MEATLTTEPIAPTSVREAMEQRRAALLARFPVSPTAPRYVLPVALTPEQWAEETVDVGHGFDFPGARVEREGYTVEIMPHGHEDDPNKWITLGSDAHAVAALCLHEQPFGFNQFHVALLQTVAAEHEEYLGSDERSEELRWLAARIAALLPPEVAS